VVTVTSHYTMLQHTNSNKENMFSGHSVLLSINLEGEGGNLLKTILSIDTEI